MITKDEANPVHNTKVITLCHGIDAVNLQTMSNQYLHYKSHIVSVCLSQSFVIVINIVVGTNFYH